MGTDIHGQIEIRDKGDASGHGSWLKAGICQGDMWQERVPGIFWRLMGEPDGKGDCVPMRGFPIDASLEVAFDFGKEVKDDTGCFKDFVVTTCVAEDWNKHYGAVYFTNVDKPGAKFVSDPDWHHPGWVTADEIERCILEVFDGLDKCKSVAFEWWVLLHTMRLYESNPAYEVRYVYWFDN